MPEHPAVPLRAAIDAYKAQQERAKALHDELAATRPDHTLPAPSEQPK